MKIHSLRTKLMILFLTFFFVPYGLLTFLSVSASRQMVKRSTIEQLHNLAEVKETAIEQWLKERVSDGRTIAESAEIKSMDPSRIRPFLSLLPRFERSHLEIKVFNLQGWPLGGRSRASLQGELWFQKTLAEGTFISRPEIDPVTLRPAVVISTLIRDAKGQPAGILRQTVGLTYISDLISESKLGVTGEFFIVDPEGGFVLRNGLHTLLGKVPSPAAYFAKAPFRPSYTGIYRGYRGNEVLGSWKWIASIRCYLIAEQDSQEAFSQINLMMKKALLIFICAAALIILISYAVIGKATGPIRRLSETVALFAEGHFGKTVSTTRADEIGKLITGFNTMAEKLKKAYTDLEGRVEASNKELEVAYQLLKRRQQELLQSEKMAALGQLSAGIAHEIRNPMTSIKIFIQSLEKEIDLDENQKEDFRIVMREIDRINEYITRLLNFARPDDLQLQPVNIGTLVRETANLLAAKLKNGAIRLDISIPGDLPPVMGDPKQLSQAILNLMLNAAAAMPTGGILTILSTIEADPELRQPSLRLTLQDTGRGIPKEDLPCLFDPFFTTTPGGTGLGLSIVYSIIRKHNGRIEVASEPGKGASFILSLPIQKEGVWNGFSSSTMT
jgi:two-component system, NtrC family, sensor kinase